MRADRMLRIFGGLFPLFAFPAAAEELWQTLPRPQQDAMIAIEVVENSAAACGITFDPQQFARIYQKKMLGQGASKAQADLFLKAFTQRHADLREIDKLPKHDPAQCGFVAGRTTQGYINAMRKGDFPSF